MVFADSGVKSDGTAQVSHGPRIDPFKRVMLYSAAEWEVFMREGVQPCVTSKDTKVVRPTWAGDKGLEVAGVTDEKRLAGLWDNDPCQPDGKPLRPGDAWPESGTIRGYWCERGYSAGTTTMN